MSRQNKVNPGQYTRAGRLSPDDLGRERRLQRGKTASAGVLQGKPGVPQGKKSAWEPPAPSPKVAPSATPGVLKVAAARSVIGVTRLVAGAVKALAKPARKVVGNAKTRASATTATKPTKPTKAPARTGTAPARTPPAAKR